MIQDITHQPFDEYVTNTLLKPLGMNWSWFKYPQEQEFKTRGDDDDDDDDKIAQPYDSFARIIPMYRYAEQAASGFYTCEYDLSIFFTRLFFTNDILNDAMRTEMLSPQFIMFREPSNNNEHSSDKVPENVRLVQSSVGLGTFISKFSNGISVVAYAGGTNRGYRSIFTYSPETQLGIIGLTNSENGFRLTEKLHCHFTMCATRKEGISIKSCDTSSEVVTTVIAITMMFMLLVSLIALTALLMLKKLKLAAPFLPLHRSLTSVNATYRTKTRIFASIDEDTSSVHSKGEVAAENSNINDSDNEVPPSSSVIAAAPKSNSSSGKQLGGSFSSGSGSKIYMSKQEDSVVVHSASSQQRQVLCSILLRILVIVTCIAIYVAFNIIFNTDVVVRAYTGMSHIILGPTYLPYNFAWFTLIVGACTFSVACMALFVYQANDNVDEFIEDDEDQQHAHYRSNNTRHYGTSADDVRPAARVDEYEGDLTAKQILAQNASAL